MMVRDVCPAIVPPKVVSPFWLTVKVAGLPPLVTVPPGLAAPLKLGTLTLLPARSKVPPLAAMLPGAQGVGIAQLQEAVLD